MSGISGVYSTSGESVADEIYDSVIALQNRGEEGCGVSLSEDAGFYSPKARKLAFYFFKERTGGLEGLRERSPSAAIGHTLYEDTGGLQPVEQWCEKGLLSLAMDGVLLGFGGKNDSVMRSLFSRAIDSTDDCFQAVEKVMTRLDGHGSYCVASLVKKGDDVSLVAFRDPKGIKPYCLGKKDGKYIVASESKAIDGADAELVRDIKPGEAIVISRKGLDSRQIIEQDHAHCFFEWMYFADPTSIIEGRDVYGTRKAFGDAIAERHYDVLNGLDLMMASPDSGRGVAIGAQQGIIARNVARFLEEVEGFDDLEGLRAYVRDNTSGLFLPYEEACVKNNGAKRTFQVEEEAERKAAARNKFFMNGRVVRGKNVGVGDDSIVRGTVFRDGMIYKLKKAGAGKIVPVISCPALIHACIKDPKGKDFVAKGLEGSIEEVGAEVAGRINADFVCYPSTEDMVNAVGCSDLCMACVDGNFPVKDEFCK